MLNNILLKGDRAVDIANAPASGASLSQRELLNLAESQCHKLILGHTLTSDTSQHGGSLAQAKVHAGVHAEVVKKRAAFVADVLNSQLIPAIVLLNYGTLDVPMPELVFKLPQEGVTLERVQVLKTALEIKGMRIKKSEGMSSLASLSPPRGITYSRPRAMAARWPGLPGCWQRAKGKGKPQDTTGPEDDPPKPKKKAKPSTADDAEPVSAAPTDPAQEWLAPIKQKFLEARKAGASMADMRKMLLTLHPNTQALAKAFANNILAGFAGEGEEVDAANPYGCNQYGEGWRMPHNGRASKDGAPVKKTDLTEEERKQKEEEERKRKEEEQQRKEEEERKAREEAKKAEEKHPIGQATTREEAIEHTRSLLSPEFRETGEVEFDDSVTLEQINEINATLKELTDKYPVKTLRRIGTYVDESDTVGAQATSTKIEFNIDHENGGIKGLHNWRPYGYDKVQETGYTRHNVGATNNGISLRDLTTHEYGHVIQAKISREYEWLQNKKAQGYDISKFDAQYEAMKKWRRVYGRAKTEKGYPPRSDIQRNLSKYAMKNDREFFSECFAARERGEKLPAYIEKGLDDMISFVNMNS